MYKFVSWILSLAIAVGHVRIHDKEAVLLNNLRKEIYYYILDNSCAHLREIKRRFNVSISTVMASQNPRKGWFNKIYKVLEAG